MWRRAASGSSFPMRLIISRSLLGEIEAHLHAALPHECCGLLVGTRTEHEIHALRIVPSENVNPAPDTFEIDPALLLRLQRELRGGPHALVGLYHSHPGGTPHPSPRDVAGATYPGFVWLIAASAPGGAISHGAFWHDARDGVPPRGLTAIAMADLSLPGPAPA